MTSRTILLTLHIAAIASWFGADVMQHAMRHRWGKETLEGNKAWARMVFWLHDRYYAVVVAVIIITGVGLVFDGDWSWGSGFIWVGVGAIVAGATLGGISLKGLAKKRVESLEAGDPEGAHAASRQMLPIEVILTVIVLITIVAMVHKWGA
jgi:hypothetical protein